MKQLIAVILGPDIDAVTKELLRQGVLHFINIKEVSKDWDSKADEISLDTSREQISDIKKRIVSFLSLINVHPMTCAEFNVNKRSIINTDEVNAILDKIADKIQNIRDEQKRIQQEILKLEDISRQMSIISDLNIKPDANSKHSFLSIHAGTIPPQNIQSFNSEIVNS